MCCFFESCVVVRADSGDEVKIFVPEDEPPKTEAERVMAPIGFKNADKEPPNLAMGVIGAVMLVIPVLVVVVADFNTLRIHFRFMRSNLQNGYRRVFRRSTKVGPMS